MMCKCECMCVHVCVYLYVSVVMLIKIKTKNDFSKVLAFYLTNSTKSKQKDFVKLNLKVFCKLYYGHNYTITKFFTMKLKFRALTKTTTVCICVYICVSNQLS